MSQLATLPKWALVAYGARCARRLAIHAEAFSGLDGKEITLKAISLAEIAASNAKAALNFSKLFGQTSINTMLNNL